MSYPPPVPGGQPGQPGSGQPPQQPPQFGGAPPGPPGQFPPPPGSNAPFLPESGGPPPKSGKSGGKIVLSVIAGLAVIGLLVGGVLFALNQLGGSGAESASVDDCVSEPEEAEGDYMDLEAVDCDSDEAVYKIVAKEDDPDSDFLQEAHELECGFDLVFYFETEDGGDLDSVMCLNALDGSTDAPEAEDCLDDDMEIINVVECDSEEAFERVVHVTEGGLPAEGAESEEALTALAEEECGHQWETFYTSQEEDFDEPLLWLMCVVTADGEPGVDDPGDDPVDDPAGHGLPAVGDCIGAGDEVVECDDPTATEEVVTVLTDGLADTIEDQEEMDSYSDEVCDSGWESSYTNMADYGDPLEWIVCTKNV